LTTLHDALARAVGKLPPLTRDIARHLYAHDLIGEAAKMAYFFFLSVFPALLLIFALTGVIGGDEAFQRITTIVRTLAPIDASRFLHDFLTEIAAERSRARISLGALVLLWAGSSAIAALTDALNQIHGVVEGRTWWTRRLIALAILAAGSILLVLGTMLVIGGVTALRSLGMSAVWELARWPLAAALPLAAVWLAFYFLPDRSRRGAWWEALVGAIVATLLWALVTALFTTYLGSIRDISYVYGAIGAVVALLIWFFLSGVAVLVGGIVDAVLERHQRINAR
jgi:membrane protein